MPSPGGAQTASRRRAFCVDEFDAARIMLETRVLVRLLACCSANAIVPSLVVAPRGVRSSF